MKQPLFWESSHPPRARHCCFLVDSLGNCVVTDMPLAAFLAWKLMEPHLIILSDFGLSLC